MLYHLCRGWTASYIGYTQELGVSAYLVKKCVFNVLDPDVDERKLSKEYKRATEQSKRDLGYRWLGWDPNAFGAAALAAEDSAKKRADIQDRVSGGAVAPATRMAKAVNRVIEVRWNIGHCCSRILSRVWLQAIILP